MKDTKDIPTSLANLKQYFPRLYRIQSSVKPRTLKEGVDWYLNGNKHGLYLAQIQAEAVDTILWLTWSSDLTDTSILRPAIEEELFNRTGRQIPVGLRWRTIQLDKPGRIPDDEVVNALHIEVDREHRNEAKQALEDIYSSKATVFPLHLRLRAVPLFKDVMNNQVKVNIKHLTIGRQASFNDTDSGNLTLKHLHLEKHSGI
jgi:hypothetical protein